MGKPMSVLDYEDQKKRRAIRARRKKAWMQTERWKIKNSEEYLKRKQEREVIWRQKQEQLRAELEAAQKPESEPQQKLIELPSSPIFEEEPPVDIGRWDLRVGKIFSAYEHPLVYGYLLVFVFLKEEQLTMVVSNLGYHYKLEDLQQDVFLGDKGIDTIVLRNSKPAKIYGLITDDRLICAEKDGKVELLKAPHGSEANDPIYVKGFPRKPDTPYMKPYKNIYETVVQDLWVDDKRRVLYKGLPLKVEGRRGFVKTRTLTDCQVKIV